MTIVHNYLTKNPRYKVTTTNDGQRMFSLM